MRYVNAAQAARILGIGDKTIRRWLKEGKKLPGAIMKANGEYAIPESEVEELRQLRLKYAKDEKGSYDQSSDVATLAEKLAVLEQEVAELRKWQSFAQEHAPSLPVEIKSIPAIPQKVVAQNRTTIAKKEVSQKRDYTTAENIPADWVLCSDFFDTYVIAETTCRRWLKNGLEGETFESETKPRSGRQQEYRYFTSDQRLKALDILKRHGKLENILASRFAEFHGVEFPEFEDHMTHGLGPGLIGMSTDTMPQRDQVEYSERNKPGRKGEKEKYLTQDQQCEAIAFWKRHDVNFSQCDRDDCPCHD